MRKLSEVDRLIGTFTKVWEAEYGEKYEYSPKDFKQAKLYLQMREGFNLDNITARATIYLKEDGIWAENRHGFAAFIANINRFIPPKKQRPEPIKMWTCDSCGKKMPENKQYGHWQECPNYKPASKETIQSALDELKMNLKKEE